MTREQRFLFKIAAKGRGGGFMNRMTFDGGGNQFAGRSTGLGSRSLVRTPGQRTVSGGTSWLTRSAQAGLVTSNRHKRLQLMAQQAAKAGPTGTYGLTPKAKPYNYAANSIFTPTKPPEDGTVYAAYNKSKIEQQIADPRWKAADRAKLQNMLGTSDQFVENRAKTNFAEQAAKGKTFADLALRKRFIDQQKQFYVDNRDKQAVRMRGSGTTGSQGQFNDANWNPSAQAHQVAGAQQNLRSQYKYLSPDSVQTNAQYDNWLQQNNRYKAAWGSRDAMEAPNYALIYQPGWQGAVARGYADVYNRNMQDAYYDDVDSSIRQAYGQPQYSALPAMTPQQQQQINNLIARRKAAAGIPYSYQQVLNTYNQQTI